MPLSTYWKFYKVAKVRAKNHDNYVRFEQFQAKIVTDSFKQKKINLKGKKVLDIGCGRGGYTKRFTELGADTVSLDITPEYFQFKKTKKFVLGNAVYLPFKDNSFDFIFSSNLIEHVNKPQTMVKELYRTLKPGGICYLSFPPFWSPVGAHQFKPFHYFGETIATALSRWLYGVKSYKYNDKWGKLYIRTIGQVRRYIKKAGFKVRSTTTRMLPYLNTAKIPLLNELLTWHVEFVLKK